ncbi:30S ribosomal protein S2 [candidate division WWE3 bacterium]|nr:30S ribosomal protein S2 [candidate division WWE3 bacterium]
MANFKLPKIEELFEAGVHFGHQVKRWNPGMEKYIFAERSGIHIIDLDTTHKKLEEAAEKLFEIASTGGQIIFVGTKRQARDIISLEAKRSGALFMNERWLGGMITNFRVLKKKIDKLVDFMRKRESGEFNKYTKKERLLIDREIEKLNSSVGGIVGLQGKPAAVLVIDTKREKTAIKEAKAAKLPVFAILDTNGDPSEVTYPIPGNDDAIRSIAILMKTLADAVESGYTDYAKKVEAKKIKLAESIVTPTVSPIKEAIKASSSESSHVTEATSKIQVEVKAEEVLVEKDVKVETTKADKTAKKTTDKRLSKKLTAKK